WQFKVIKINTNSLVTAGRPPVSPARRKLPNWRGPAPSDLTFRAEAQRAADELARYAIRRRLDQTRLAWRCRGVPARSVGDRFVQRHGRSFRFSIRTRCRHGEIRIT